MIPQQSLDFLDNPPAYTSPDILESSKEDNPTEVPFVSPQNDTGKPTNQMKQDTDMTPRAQSEPEKSSQEPPAPESDPAEVHPHGGQGQVQREEHEVQQHGIGQNRAEIELSTLNRQPSLSVNPRPQQVVLTQPTRPDRHTPPSTPQQKQAPNSRGGGGVGGWFKSLTDNL